jgi:protein-S-isoprenylcysteine O-methyltransferase Ste14
MNLWVFICWSLLFGAYFLAGSCLIPHRYLVRWQEWPKDRAFYVGNALWWLIPASWFLSPACPPFWLWLIGASLFAGGMTLHIAARRVNPWFLPMIISPGWIVRQGPYKWLRHPGYSASMAMATGSWLTLGHEIGGIPLALYIGFIFARIRIEDRILNAHPDSKSL